MIVRQSWHDAGPMQGRTPSPRRYGMENALIEADAAERLAELAGGGGN